MQLYICYMPTLYCYVHSSFLYTQEVESLHIQAHKIASIEIYCKPVPIPFCSINATVFTWAFCPNKVILDQEMD